MISFLHYRLVCGDVGGKFRQLFSRVANVQKKAGPFEVPVHCSQGSHRSPKVLNVLEFDFSIRVPSNVLEFH